MQYLNMTQVTHPSGQVRGEPIQGQRASMAIGSAPVCTARTKHISYLLGPVGKSGVLLARLGDCVGIS